MNIIDEANRALKREIKDDFTFVRKHPLFVVLYIIIFIIIVYLYSSLTTPPSPDMTALHRPMF